MLQTLNKEQLFENTQSSSSFHKRKKITTETDRIIKKIVLSFKNIYLALAISNQSE